MPQKTAHIPKGVYRRAPSADQVAGGQTALGHGAQQRRFDVAAPGGERAAGGEAAPGQGVEGRGRQ